VAVTARAFSERRRVGSTLVFSKQELEGLACRRREKRHGDGRGQDIAKKEVNKVAK